MKRPINPYIAGDPVTGRSSFFGRLDILDWVSRQLHTLQTKSLVVFGQRRIGKTSLLLQLEKTLSREHYCPVYFDLHFQSRVPLGAVLADLADTMAPRLRLPDPDPQAFDDQGRFFRRHFLPQVYRAIKKDIRLVFLVDEFDVLDRVSETNLPEAAASKQLIPFLNRLMTTESRLAFVFAVGRRVDDLSLDVKATFRSSLARRIWVLDPDSADALVRQAEANDTLSFTDAAVDRILSLTSRHPYLTQLLCQCIWDRAFRREKDRFIRPIDAEQAIEEALERGDYALDSIWNGMAPEEKVFAAAVGQIAKEGEPVAEDAVMQTIGDHAPHRRTLEVENAYRALLARQILQEPQPKHYRFEIEIIRRWIRQRRPLFDVEEELDRLKPEAEDRFCQGEHHFRKKQWSKAESFFSQALAINPRHFKARLLRGEAFLMMTEPAKATNELKHAHKLNPKGARLSLARALVAYANEVLVTEEDKALNLCESALRILPKDPSALKLAKQIWSKKGDSSLRQKDIDHALIWYRKAGNLAMIEKVEYTIRSRMTSAAEAVKQTARIAELLASIASACRIVAASDPESRSSGILWGAVRIFLAEADVSRKITDGLNALIDGKFMAASTGLESVNRIYPKNERNAPRAFIQRALRGIEDKPSDYEPSVPVANSQIQAIASLSSRLVRSAQDAIAACERAQPEKSVATSHNLWKKVLKHLHDKQNAFSNYQWGLGQLEKGNFKQAENVFGWTVDPRI